MARLSKPPQDAPMPNSVSASMKACTAASRHRLEHDAEQAAGAGEIALPDRVAGTAFKRRMQHARDLRPLLEPARDLQPRLMVVRQPHRHGAQPAQAEIHVVGADAEAHA